MNDDVADFFSSAFDAVKALYTEETQAPMPNARPLDNLYQCRHLLPSDHPEYKEKIRSQQHSSKQDISKQRLPYIKQLNDRKLQRSNPLDEIAAHCSAGPLGKLSQWYKDRQKVYVVTRHRKGTRGRAYGTLVAFDKHFNVVLKDVDETYTVLLKVQRTTASGKLRLAAKQEHRQRRLKQVFIAGNTIVSIFSNI